MDRRWVVQAFSCLAIVAGVAGIALKPGTTWAECPGVWKSTSGLPGADAVIKALAVYDDGSGPALYAGGSFQVIGNSRTSGVACWNGQTWAPLGEGLGGILSGAATPEVKALAVYNGELYAGGSIGLAGGREVNRIARWNGVEWRSVGAGMDHDVNGLTVFNGELVAGGDFLFAGGQGARFVARWNGSNWSRMGNAIPDVVTAVGLHQTDLYAAGGFQRFRWNGTDWNVVGSIVASNVRRMRSYRGELYTVGEFINNGQFHRLEAGDWVSMVEGFIAPLRALHVDDGDILIGGGIVGVEDAASTAWARLGCPFGLGDLNCDGRADFDDISPFVLAITGPAAYDAAFPTCQLVNGDFDGDALVLFDDIDAFVARIAGG